MNKYFSKLAKHTGIAVNGTGNGRRRSDRNDIPSAFQPGKTAPKTGGLEANVETIGEPDVSQKDFPTESLIDKNSRLNHKNPAGIETPTSMRTVSSEQSELSGRGNDQLQFAKAGSVKKESNHGFAEVSPHIPEMTVHGSIPRPETLEREDPPSRDTTGLEDQSRTGLSATTPVKKDESDNVLSIEKQQYIPGPENRVPGQNNFRKEDWTYSQRLLESNQQHIRKDKSIEVKIISPAGKNREAGESGADPFGNPFYRRFIESPPPFTAVTASEKGRIAETTFQVPKSEAHDNSVDIHIDTISFEVHQAPEKNTMTESSSSVPGPIVMQKAPPTRAPRLSRYYLRGL